jgi:hypothetical protein
MWNHLLDAPHEENSLKQDESQDAMELKAQAAKSRLDPGRVWQILAKSEGCITKDVTERANEQ